MRIKEGRRNRRLSLCLMNRAEISLFSELNICHFHQVFLKGLYIWQEENVCVFHPHY